MKEFYKVSEENCVGEQEDFRERGWMLIKLYFCIIL